MKDDPQPNPFAAAKVISVDTDAQIYLATGKEYQRGDPNFVMSSGNLLAYLENPHKWRHGVAVEDSATQSQDFGSWLDCNLLVPQLAEKRFAVTPETYEATVMRCPVCGSDTDSKKCAKDKVDRVETTVFKPWNNQTNTCSDWCEAQEREGRHVIDRKTHVKVLGAMEVVRASETVCRLVEGSHRQVFCMAEYHDAETGIIVPIKTLPDLVPVVEPWEKVVFDLKSARDGNPFGWPYVGLKNGYHVQLALYAGVLEATGEYGERNTGAHLVIENEPPYHIVEPFPALTAEFFHAGREWYLAALRHYCKALQTGIWTGYPVPPGTVKVSHMQFLNPPEKIAYLPEEHPGGVAIGKAERDPDEVGIVP